MEEKKETWINRNWLLILVTLICLGIIGSAIYVYRSQFGTILSTSKNDFGTFGDYLNPAIGIINILLLLFIAIEVKKTEDKRLKQSLDHQVRITKSQMRNEKVVELSKILDYVYLEGINNEIDLDIFLGQTNKTAINTSIFFESTKYLFNTLYENTGFETNKKSLIDVLDLIIEKVKLLIQLRSDLKDNTLKKEETGKFFKENNLIFTQLIRDYFLQKTMVVNYMNIFILLELETEKKE